jgi:hypothetical protein
MTITSNNNPLTINATVNGAQNLTLNAGSNGNITLNANLGDITRLGVLTLQNLHNLTSNGTIKTTSYVQNAGSGLTQFNNGGLDVTNGASIAANRVTGNVNVGAFTINLSTGNMNGTVNGLSGADAIRAMTVLNTIIPGSIFFDGIDISTILTPPPIPPIPPLPPTPYVNPGQVTPNYDYSTQSLYGLTPTPLDILFFEMLNGNDKINLHKITSNCVRVTPEIEICAD